MALVGDRGGSCGGARCEQCAGAAVRGEAAGSRAKGPAVGRLRVGQWARRRRGRPHEGVAVGLARGSRMLTNL